uniref:Uncharacterized protein n=1 Tax=Picea glauca TaxID=3330 RepID=A0A101LZM3_PICGL|nr:hypothetical protein ABT39_MTgene5264 [Picea glauca]QHR88808.1 hypothetical protein Q903MT_gene2824 [Picea sitchensis]
MNLLGFLLGVAFDKLNKQALAFDLEHLDHNHEHLNNEHQNLHPEHQIPSLTSLTLTPSSRIIG